MQETQQKTQDAATAHSKILLVLQVVVTIIRCRIGLGWSLHLRGLSINSEAKRKSSKKHKPYHRKAELPSRQCDWKPQLFLQ